MFGKSLISDMISRSSESSTDRRNFMRTAGLAGMGVLGAGAVGTATAGAASAAADDGAVTDGAIFNFALNLEYLEAEFYSYAAYGHGLDDADTDGKGQRGGVTGGAKVPFTTPLIAQYADEIAGDEIAHVKFLRRELGSAAVARPTINLRESFSAAATAAGLIKPGEVFDPFADENSFLLGAFIFEDVGVTAYKGAAPLISNKAYLEAAAGILAFEAYHAATIRTVLLSRDLGAATNAISDARDSLDGESDLDEGAIGLGRRPINITPGDDDAIAISRTPGQVLNVVYLTPGKAEKGGFFPDGVNGDFRVSG